MENMNKTTTTKNLGNAVGKHMNALGKSNNMNSSSMNSSSMNNNNNKSSSSSSNSMNNSRLTNSNNNSLLSSSSSTNNENNNKDNIENNIENNEDTKKVNLTGTAATANAIANAGLNTNTKLNKPTNNKPNNIRPNNNNNIRPNNNNNIRPNNKKIINKTLKNIQNNNNNNISNTESLTLKNAIKNEPKVNEKEVEEDEEEEKTPIGSETDLTSVESQTEPNVKNNMNTKNSISLNRLCMNLLNHQIVMKLFHFQTQQYGAHKASDAYIEKYAGTLDKFLEVAQGIYGKVTLKKYSLAGSSHNDENIIKHINGMITYWRTKIDDILDNYTDLINIRDELVADADQLKYLLTFK